MLTLKQHFRQDTKVLELSGRVDSHSKVGLEVAIWGAKESGCHHIIVNFSNLTWIDSVGLGQIFLWYHGMKSEGIRLSIVCSQALVRELLELTSQPEGISFYRSEEEAVVAMGASIQSSAS